MKKLSPSAACDRLGKGLAAGSEDIETLTETEQETELLGSALAACLVQGDVVALVGELASGKTTITRGIARGLGVPDDVPITSPTFTLINEYHGSMHIYHVDTYRLNRPEEFVSLGYEELLDPDGVTVIEWAEKIEDLIVGDYWRVDLSHAGESSRRIAIRCISPSVNR